MLNDTPHICVCICTFRRLPFLRRLLAALATQETGNQFTYSVVVADNDAALDIEAGARRQVHVRTDACRDHDHVAFEQ